MQVRREAQGFANLAAPAALHVAWLELLRQGQLAAAGRHLLSNIRQHHPPAHLSSRSRGPVSTNPGAAQWVPASRPVSTSFSSSARGFRSSRAVAGLLHRLINCGQGQVAHTSAYECHVRGCA